MPSDSEKAKCKTKTRYDNEPAAKESIKRLRDKKGVRKTLRTYHCPVCFKYHITSSPRR